jgi:DUF2997 family protein
MPRVTVIIAPNGSTTFEVDGVKGSGCEKVTAAFQRALGKTTSDRKTAEYYEEETEQAAERRLVTE